MAYAAMTGAALEFARSIEVASIPEKLRCATCDKVAIDAVKLPCCDSSICSDCKETSTATECPVCAHSPFSADTAINAKSLRTTVNVFLKTEAKKRGMDIKGDTLKPLPTAAAPTPPVAATPAAVSEAVPPPAEEQQELIAPAGIEEPASNGESDSAGAANTDVDTANSQDEQAVVKAADVEQDDDEESDDDDVVITTERPEGADEEQEQEQQHEQNHYEDPTNGENMSGQNMAMNQQQGFGFDQNMAGFTNAGFGNMGMNGFNPMMGMMGMGMPNMMGMPGIGMGMDPSMMFNGGFGGMGDMSAMMGMGMNAMGMGDMSGMGNFGGMNGPGFFPNQGNYMQSQNFGNAPRQNFFNERGFRGGRGGFGRGSRGNFGRGRGGFGFQQQQHYGGQHSDFPPNAPTGPSGARQQTGANTTEIASRRRGSPTYDAVQGPNGSSAEPRGQSQEQAANGAQESVTETNNAEGDTNATDEISEQTQQNGERAPEVTEDAANYGADNGDGAIVDGVGEASASADGNVESVVVADSQYGGFDDGSQYDQQGNASMSGRGGFRGRSASGYAGYQGRGTDSTELTPKPAPPVNAPTGPKALRQGLPNTGWVSRASFTKPTPTTVPQRSGSQARSVEHSRYEAHNDRDYDARDRSTSRSGSKYRSREDKERDAEDEYEDEEASARRKERKRRRDRERKYEEDDRDEDTSSRKHRSRSESREDDGSRRRHRDKDEEYRSSRSHRDRSKDRHRSRRHRSKSPAKDHGDDHHSRRKGRRDDRYDDYKDSRSSRKGSRRDDEYEYDDSKKDRSSRSSRHDRGSRDERPRPVIEPPSDELGFKIKGSTKNKKDIMAPPSTFHRERSDRRGSATAEAASSDPYAEERARAQQDREAKEAQRRQSTNDSRSSLGKRGREYEEDLGVPTGPKGDRNRIKKSRKERRISYKYEDEVQLS